MICIINCGTSWIKEIVDHVVASGQEYEVIQLDQVGESDFSKYSGIIISGAAILLTESDVDDYIELFRFIKTTHVPILGICLGHQLLGLVYGAQLSKGDIIDTEELIRVVEDGVLFSGVRRPMFREEHSEHITLPQDFQLLAQSRSCKNEAMKHKEFQKYGVQFHPEVSGESGAQLMKNFLNLCK